MTAEAGRGRNFVKGEYESVSSGYGWVQMVCLGRLSEYTAAM